MCGSQCVCMCVCACVQKQLKHAHSHWKAAAEAEAPTAAEEVVKVARAPAYFVNYTKTKLINKRRVSKRNSE